MADNDMEKRESHGGGFLNWVIRLVVAMVILAIASFLTPGFSINGLWSFLVAAVIITALDYLVESFMGVDASPIGKGIKGFLIAAIILYVAQFIVPSMKVSILGALLAAIVIGILDMIIPGRFM
ncbi:4 TMS phage holin, superfamily IV [Clostridium cavendishii DSM 21758]|uniref:4 TMS phage holin, superfamily IV n=1 Tax=Clostridium cavendishii DSM 21758 TaxID=1121302 RepID=A0A1M6N7Q2_9CLOT|nr:phage holin family protein [Clostridium cavendishii]SHJ91721.1 4 TMS phage holin, superfamily IV [Clostridium cavendishii DSM 21758]